MNTSRHTHEWVGSLVTNRLFLRFFFYVCANERITCTNKMSCVMSHLWSSHVLHMNTSRHTHKWVYGLVTDCLFLRFVFVQHIKHESRMSRITCTNEINCVMSHSWISHVLHMSTSCHTHEWVRSLVTDCLLFRFWVCEWVMSRVRMRWIASCHIYEWVMSHLWIRHVTHVNECVV